jgi:putative ABC transport system ATP-binding protein
MERKAFIAHDVVKTFNATQPNEVLAVKGVSLTIETGEVIALRGPSGSGKTTLLSVLGCMTKPTSGDVFVLGERVTKWSEQFLTLFRRKHIGFVFQNFSLISNLSAYQNIELPVLPMGWSSSTIGEKIAMWSQRLQIAHRLNFNVDLLSGGEMQRVAIARSLLADPEIVMADEPTAHLDTVLSKEIIEIFAALKNLGKTIVIATHDPLVYESDIIDRVMNFRDGQLVDPGGIC